MQEQVPFSLREIVADTLEISPDVVTPELSSDSVETWDSFRHLQLILSLESEYGIQFDPAEIPDMTTIDKVQLALKRKGVHFD